MHGFVTYVNVPDALTLNQSDLTRLFSEARTTGFEAARLRVPWNAVNTAPGTFTWEALDRAVNAALAANLPVMLTLQQPAPSWVTLVTRQSLFAAFAAAVASRYRVGGLGITVPGRSVSQYQIWDEPNAINENWPYQVVQVGTRQPVFTPAIIAQQYANLLKNAAIEIRRVAPGAKIVFAGLRATTSTRYDNNTVSPVRYVTDAYTIARPYFDALAYHPLSLPTAQFTNPPAPTAASIAQSDAVRQVMVQRGDSAKKLYWTQLGWDTTKVTQTQQKYYLETMRWFAWRRRDHVAGIALDYKDSTDRAAGLVTSNFTAKAAKATVARWHDGVKRHTLYTVCGTQQDGWGLVGTGLTTAEQQAALATYAALGGTGTPTPGEHPGDFRSPDTIMGTRANANLFNWVPISYPASAPIGAAPLDNRWQPQTISMADSINAGVAELVAMIKATPGTFALAGMSQGSAVISQVLRQMQPGGPLANRAQDCIAGIAFGNPSRRPGTAFAGMTPAPGAGLIWSTGAVPGLSTVPVLPSWWMELCTPGDPVGGAPMTGAAGTLISQVSQALVTFKGGGTDMLKLATNLLTALSTNGAGLSILSTVISFAVARILRIKPPAAVTALEQFVAQQSAFGLQNPHIMYGAWKPPTLPVGVPGLDGNSNYIDVGAAFLNARGAAVAPR